MVKKVVKTKASGTSKSNANKVKRTQPSVAPRKKTPLTKQSVNTPKSPPAKPATKAKATTSKDKAEKTTVAKSKAKSKIGTLASIGAAVKSMISPKAKPKSAKKRVPVSKPPQIEKPRTVTGYQGEPYPIMPTESYMNDNQLQHFRQILNAWRGNLMKEVDNTISDMKASSTEVLADLNDRATQEETFALKLRARDRERKLLKKIEEALQRIDDKEYGYCESCGEEIGIRRLEARPTAVLCIDCKTLDEIREKRSVS